MARATASIRTYSGGFGGFTTAQAAIPFFQRRTAEELAIFGGVNPIEVFAAECDASHGSQFRFTQDRGGAARWPRKAGYPGAVEKMTSPSESIVTPETPLYGEISGMSTR